MKATVTKPRALIFAPTPCLSFFCLQPMEMWWTVNKLAPAEAKKLGVHGNGRDAGVECGLPTLMHCVAYAPVKHMRCVPCIRLMQPGSSVSCTGTVLGHNAPYQGQCKPVNDVLDAAMPQKTSPVPRSARALMRECLCCRRCREGLAVAFGRRGRWPRCRD
eukprot:355407-Chlamydomonas_euryale.AAC.2